MLLGARVRAAAVAVVVVLVAAPTAQACMPQAVACEDQIAQASSALRRSPVYVDPYARPTVGRTAARALTEHVRRAARPMYVAVLPSAALDDAGGSVNATLRGVVAGVGRRGTYVLVVGREAEVRTFRIGGDRGFVADGARRRVKLRGDLGPAITEFLGRIRTTRDPVEPRRRGSGAPVIPAKTLGVALALSLVAAAGVLQAWRRRRIVRKVAS